jgi:hypothetical protein
VYVAQLGAGLDIVDRDSSSPRDIWQYQDIRAGRKEQPSPGMKGRAQHRTGVPVLHLEPLRTRKHISKQVAKSVVGRKKRAVTESGRVAERTIGRNLREGTSICVVDPGCASPPTPASEPHQDLVAGGKWMKLNITGLGKTAEWLHQMPFTVIEKVQFNKVPCIPHSGIHDSYQNLVICCYGNSFGE